MYIVAITHSEFAPDFDVRGVGSQVVGEDSVDVAGDGGATLAEDAGDAFTPTMEAITIHAPSSFLMRLNSMHKSDAVKGSRTINIGACCVIY